MDMVERQNGTPKACAARAPNISPLAWNRPVRPVGPMPTGMVPALAKNRGGELLLRHVDHDALAQLDGVRGPPRLRLNVTSSYEPRSA